MALWNIYQELEIRQGEADDQMSDEMHSSRIFRVQANREKVENRFEKLLILAEAIWESAAERLQLTNDDLLDRDPRDRRPQRRGRWTTGGGDPTMRSLPNGD